MTQQPEAPGMRSFVTIWLGQLISLLGSGLTSFALGVWVFQQTGSVTQYALIALCAVLPGVVLSPLAGVLADRLDRRTVMICSDAGAGLSTLMIIVLLWSGELALWHIYLASMLNAIASAFQWPAYMASIRMLVPERHFGRASGMTQLAEGAAQILAPLLAGLLIAAVQLQGILLLDVCSFVFAVGTQLLVRIPRPPASSVEGDAAAPLLDQATFGWRYIKARSGLLALLGFFVISNLMFSFVSVLLTPLILSFADTITLGTVISISGLGMLLGGVLMSVWGGPRRRVLAILGASLLQALVLFLAGFQPNSVLISLAAFIFLFSSPIISACSQSIWLSKVAADVQGRVFAMRRMIAWSAGPLAYSVAGPLVDGVFEPLMAPQGALASSVGALIGIGAGRGIALFFILLGIMVLGATALAYSYTPLRRLEQQLPDASGVQAEGPAESQVASAAA